MSTKPRRRQPTKAELLDRMRIAQALRSPKPLRPDQLRDLSLAHHVNLDAVCSGQADPSILWEFIEAVLTWWKAAQMLQIGVAEMDVQLEVASRLCERWSRTGRVLFDGCDMQLARDGVAVMDQLAALVDTRTAWAAAAWSEIEVDRLENAARQLAQQRQSAGHAEQVRQEIRHG